MAFDHLGHDPSKPLAVLIIGSGFSGLGMAIRLQQSGITDFRILERGDSIGGTWRDNRYPGCACDVQSHLYSFSFEPNPDWTRMFAQQPEIEAYLQRCTDKHGLLRAIDFNATVVEARYDETACMWNVRTEDGRQYRSRIVVTAMGPLSTPAVPNIPGLADFKGKLFHSAQWDHVYPLENKRVAVIGTGASAIQFVPQIVPRVAHLDLYQRTPPWLLPKPDRQISRFERLLFRKLPITQKLMRAWLYSHLETRVLGFVVSPRIMKLVQLAAERHLKRQVADPLLRRKLTPDYTIGCKRVLIADDYYPALVQPKVDVVTDAVREVRGDAVVTADGVERPVDAIILGTGFAVQDMVPRGMIRGRGGRDLWEVWQAGSQAYAGTTVSGFPNLFILLGPNTGLGHSSQIYMIESQLAYVMAALQQMRRKSWRSVEVREDVQRAFNERLQHKVGSAIWNAGGCKSWYLDARGRNTTIWPGFTFMFRRKTRQFIASEYRCELETRQAMAGDASVDAR